MRVTSSSGSPKLVRPRRGWYTKLVPRIAILLLGLLASSAVADEALPRIAVAVDEVVEVKVGIAVGYRCDDPKLIDASMVTRDGANVFVVKGVAAGKTLCRVGIDPQQASVLYEVVVGEKKPVAKPKRPAPRYYVPS